MSGDIPIKTKFTRQRISNVPKADLRVHIKFRNGPLLLSIERTQSLLEVDLLVVASNWTRVKSNQRPSSKSNQRPWSKTRT